MSQDIKVGDLVVVVRGCCDVKLAQGLGFIGRVDIVRISVGIRCTACGVSWQEGKAGFPEGSKINGAPLSWLRRIPPLQEPQSIIEQVEHKEPA